ncbi:hypothetical protein EVAR_35882_1 [Eumeta japonica]|uniref:Uncharacterized protein n=1 Tax=Eumeta variegata TaxID=151549 RepID=A0A4C1WUS6_EUMVA|nr:hypothetical protein EVAR_35882_1 [Eumeta japonica]
MNSGVLVLMLFVLLCAANVEGSWMIDRSLLRPERSVDCFSCATNDQQFGFLKKLVEYKDMFVKGFNSFVDQIKKQKFFGK